jgi:hypothetical protein
VWDLLPHAFDPVKTHEDEAHAEIGLPTWQRLFFHKRYWLEWCEKRWLPDLVDGRTRSFLEIGGGLCYASALAKARSPRAAVIATDVSPRYLRQHAIRTGRSSAPRRTCTRPSTPRPYPSTMGNSTPSIRRSSSTGCPIPSAPCARSVACSLRADATSVSSGRRPWMPGFAASEARTLANRAREQGTRERAIRYREWLAILKDAGMEAYCLAPVPGGRVSAPWLRRLGNGARQIYVTITFTR